LNEADFKGVLDDLSLGLVLIDSMRQVVYFNPGAVAFLDCVELSIGSTCHSCIWGNEMPCIQCPLGHDGVSPLIGERETTDERTLEIDARLRPDGSVIEIIRDISLQKSLRNDLTKATLTDPTSGLFKRRYIREMLQREMHTARVNRVELALLLIRISDITGTGVFGTPKIVAQVLRGIGEVLDMSRDLSFRFGRDTFAIILPAHHLAHALSTASTLRTRLITLGIGTVKIGISTMGNHRIADSVIQTAQKALYKAEHSEEDIVTA